MIASDRSRGIMMMNRFVFTFAGRNSPKAVYLRSIAVQNLYSPLRPPACLLESRKAYSTKASACVKENSSRILDHEDEDCCFVWGDINGDGYITEQDFAIWIKEMIKLFPDMTEEQKKVLDLIASDRSRGIIMMNRFIFTFAGRNSPKAVYLRSIAVQNLYSPLSPPTCLLESRKTYSTKANVLKKIVPEFWIMKMKTAFAWHDVNGDGYTTEQDFACFIEEMIKLFPDMTEEQKKVLEAKHECVWGNFLDGKGKGPDYKVTESMYIEKFFNVVSKEGAEDMMRKEWHKNFTIQDTDQDGVISKAEHRRFLKLGNKSILMELL